MSSRKENSFTKLADTLKKSREVKEPEVEAQETVNETSAPVSEEIVALLRQKAEAAAQAEDVRRLAEARATTAKNDLLDFMERYNMKSLPMPDREPIRVIPPSNGKDVTKRGLFKALEDQPGEAERIWNLLPQKEGGKPRLEVPPKRAEEPSEPF